MKRLKILLVDDDKMMRRLFRTFIERCGHEVVEAINGSAAAGLLESDNNIDAVVTDVRMGGGDGLALLQHISRLDRVSPCYVHSTCTEYYPPDLSEKINLRDIVPGHFPFACFHLKRDFESEIRPFLEKAEFQ